MLSAKTGIIGGVVSIAGFLGVSMAHAQAVPQITSGTASTVVGPLVQVLIDGLVWFWVNLGATFMWLALISAVVYAIYRRVHYGKVF